MGSITFDFLTESFLFREEDLNRNFSNYSEEDLLLELKNYRKHCLEYLDTIKEEISIKGGSLKFFGNERHYSEEHLKQTALYFDQIIIPDLIFPYTKEKSKTSNYFSRQLGLSNFDKIDRRSLVVDIRKMKQLSIFVEANYIKFFPSSYYFEVGNEIPFKYSDNHFSDALPSNIMEKYKDNAEVKALVRSGDKFITKVIDSPTRLISVEFKNDSIDNALLYQLYSQKIKDLDDQTRKLTLELTLPETPPSEEEFNTWVNQCINQAALSHFEKTTREIKLSSEFDAHLLTLSEFTHSMFSSGNDEKNIQDYTSKLLLNLEVPFLENVKTETLFDIRNKDGEAFQIFRKELESKFRELRIIDDEDVFEIKLQNIIHELNEVQIVKINQKLKDLRKSLINDSLLGSAGLIGNIFTSGISTYATLFALMKGYKSYSEYKKNIRENPAYFLWRVKTKRKI